jgi:hypothetical protein
MDKLKPKYCFSLRKSVPISLLPRIQVPIVHEGSGNGGFGIIWLNWILIIRRPDSERIIPFIVK